MCIRDSLYPDDEVRSGAPRRLLTQAIESGRAELEVPHVRRDGTPFLAEVVLTALRDGSGRHIGFAKVTRDLTDRRVAAENAKRLQIEQSARSAAERAEVRAHEQARRTRVLADASKYFAAADLDFDGTLVEFARPVSYTHLDVYKRQPHERTKPDREARIFPCSLRSPIRTIQ